MKRLIFIRHAHRDTSKGRELDNGLDKLGKSQRRLLTRFFLKRFSQANLVLYSSPSKRCVQTIEKIASNLKIEILLAAELVEEGEFKKGETSEQFRRRVHAFLSRLKKSKKDVVVVCGHGDWFPEALERLVGSSIELKKGGWAEMEVKELRLKLSLLIQNFNLL